MIESLFNGIITIVINLVNLILTPIDNAILHYLPDLSNMFSYVGSFFSYVSNLVPWVISYFGLSSELLSLVSLVLIFKVMASFVVYVSKLAVQWYNYLKL